MMDNMSDHRRIAHIVNTLPPYWSGTGLYAWNLANAFGKTSYEITVFAPLTSQNKNVEYHKVSVKKQKSLFRFGQAPFTPGILAIKDFDLLHLHFPYYFGGELTLINSMIRKSPLIITYHNDVFKTGVVRYLISFHTHFMATLILNKSSYICVMSEEFKNTSILLHQYSKPDNIVVIPQGVDVDRFTPDAVRKEIGFNIGNKPYILFVRSLDQAHHHSGLSSLLTAMTAVEPSHDLVVVGEGPLRKDYEREASQLRISERVHFLGAVENDKLPPLYGSASAFILPSAETENASMVIMEAMACGIPVIATRVGGTIAIVRNNIDGILVEPGNTKELSSAINYLLLNSDIAKRMGHSARDHIISNSSWEAIVARYEEIYEKAICGSV